jgi:hypothetical protein
MVANPSPLWRRDKFLSHEGIFGQDVLNRKRKFLCKYIYYGNEGTSSSVSDVESYVITWKLIERIIGLGR